MNQRTAFIFCFVLILSLAIYFAPSYLIISDAPVKSDAVVLFLGGEKGTREKEAHQLIKDGFADYLIIPAYGQVQKSGPDGKLMAFNWKRPADVSNQSNQLNKQNQQNRFVEDTHHEAVTALDMMESLGIGSSICVSSPYHMRRIKLIAGTVFKDNFTVRYVPTQHETPGETFWLFNSLDRRLVLSEYIKIGWFLLYRPFV